MTSFFLLYLNFLNTTNDYTENRFTYELIIYHLTLHSANLGRFRNLHQTMRYELAEVCRVLTLVTKTLFQVSVKSKGKARKKRVHMTYGAIRARRWTSL